MASTALVDHPLLTSVSDAQNNRQETASKAKEFLVVRTRGVAGPMGRPFSGKPEHREFSELPALGTALETQKTNIRLKTILGPRRMFRRLAHSLNQKTGWDSKTRQRHTYSIPYKYRRHEAHGRRKQVGLLLVHAVIFRSCEPLLQVPARELDKELSSQTPRATPTSAQKQGPRF